MTELTTEQTVVLEDPTPTVDELEELLRIDEPQQPKQWEREISRQFARYQKEDYSKEQKVASILYMGSEAVSLGQSREFVQALYDGRWGTLDYETRGALGKAVFDSTKGIDLLYATLENWDAIKPEHVGSIVSTFIEYSGQGNPLENTQGQLALLTAMVETGYILSRKFTNGEKSSLNNFIFDLVGSFGLLDYFEHRTLDEHSDTDVDIDRSRKAAEELYSGIDNTHMLKLANLLVAEEVDYPDALELSYRAFEAGYKVGLLYLNDGFRAGSGVDPEEEFDLFERYEKLMGPKKASTSFQFNTEHTDQGYIGFLCDVKKRFDQAASTYLQSGEGALARLVEAGPINLTQAFNMASSEFDDVVVKDGMHYFMVADTADMIAQSDQSNDPAAVMSMFTALYKAAETGFHFAVKEQVEKSRLGAISFLQEGFANLDTSIYDKNHRTD